MPPIDLLAFLVLVTAGAILANRWIRSREQAAYRQLAIDHRMHYSPADPLRLTPRVAAQLPIPGAAAVRVIDLLYRTDDQVHHYVFTVEFTLGVYGPKRRLRQAARFIESKSEGSAPVKVEMADGNLCLIDQYRALIVM